VHSLTVNTLAASSQTDVIVSLRLGVAQRRAVDNDYEQHEDDLDRWTAVFVVKYTCRRGDVGVSRRATVHQELPSCRPIDLSAGRRVVNR